MKQKKEFELTEQQQEQDFLLDTVSEGRSEAALEAELQSKLAQSQRINKILVAVHEMKLMADRDEFAVFEYFACLERLYTELVINHPELENTFNQLYEMVISFKKRMSNCDFSVDDSFATWPDYLTLKKSMLDFEITCRRLCQE